eukprot:Nitzschia sp. Nitz4//scaffold53_size117307//40329//41918//NITZ4_003765-RA/size117307-processed-gene-0.9-mRNA-1//1//CDS//3329554190//739//frame0
MSNTNRPLRSASPDRMRSKSLVDEDQTRRPSSPFVRRREKEEDLHPSEIDLLQQLCLDKLDENGAIEILLDGDDSNDRLFPGYSPNSKSTKKGFLKRLFRSPKSKPALIPATPPTSTSSDSQPSSTDDSDNFIPKPPSQVRRTRSSRGHSLATIPISNRILSDKFDNVSNVSSLSGSYDSSMISSRRPTLHTPLQLDRHESMGMDSIQDIRKTLKQMDRQLNKATTTGERISRQKVMEALFTVADSLEDMEERDVIRTELEALMNKERQQPTVQPLAPRSTNIPALARARKTEHAKRKKFRAARPPTKRPSNKENGPFHLLSSMGNMFRATNDDKKAVERALDDLLWTEFVAARKDREEIIAARGSGGSLGKGKGKVTDKTKLIAPPRKPVMEPKLPNPPTVKIHTVTENSRPSPPKTRSWWPRSMTEGQDENGSFSSSFSWEDEVDEESSSSDSSSSSSGSSCSSDSGDLGYLPKNIVVLKEPNGAALASRRSSPNKKPPQPSVQPLKTGQYRVKMVDTESRLGFEMG